MRLLVGVAVRKLKNTILAAAAAELAVLRDSQGSALARIRRIARATTDPTKSDSLIKYARHNLRLVGATKHGAPDFGYGHLVQPGFLNLTQM